MMRHIYNKITPEILRRAAAVNNIWQTTLKEFARVKNLNYRQLTVKLKEQREKAE